MYHKVFALQKRTNKEWRNQQTVSLLISPLTYLFISQKDELVFISKLIKSVGAAAIETMGTYLALWKTDSLKRRRCKDFTRMKN